jgi:MoaA/NifB/PqqE/SkfB family radical SAM enzyme
VNLPVAANIWTDITVAWDRAHAHLRPLADRLALRADERHACPAGCGGGAVDVVAHVRAGGTWQERSAVRYCFGCDHFFVRLDPGDPSHAGAARNPHVDAVNARLWSATPTFLNIEPTTLCNFSCWYCVGLHMKQDNIRVEDFARVLDNFPGVRTIALVGEGEPLMHKGFFKMARMAVERGIRVVTLSNGSTLSNSNVRKICEAGITYFSVSIDSFDPATFASSRIGGNLEQVLNGIRRLRDYRDANGFRYPKIALKGTLFGTTQDQLPRIVDLAKAHGVEIFESFQPLNPMRTYVPIYPREKLAEIGRVGAVAAAISRDTSYAHQVLQSVHSFFEAEGVDIDKNGTPNGLRAGCDEQWIYSLLSGDVTPCCQIKTPISPDWNLCSHTIDEILSDRLYENTRFNLWNGLFPRYCEGCWKTRQPAH